MEHISRYIDVKHGRAAPEYPHDDMAGILDETYGVITYQDQVLEIAKQFAGYSLGQADVMRKAMGKKIPEVMLAERENFISGVQNQGYTQQLAELLFDLIEPFAGYAFNKAHAFSYGVIAYQTAYLKAHYPIEFMTAVLVSAGGSQDRIAIAAAESTRLGIEVLPPDVNSSSSRFTIAATDAAEHDSGSSAIRFGLSQIKNVGAGAIDGLLEERAENGPFASLEDFARRINPRDLNRRALDSLAKAGALDSLDGASGRASVVAGVERILSLAQQEQRLRETGQTSMFDMFGSEQDTPLPALELPHQDAPKQELLGWERELLGIYITSHPFKDAGKVLSQYVTAQSADLTSELTGRHEVIAGVVTSVRSLSTRQGKPFAAVTLEDLSGPVEVTIWPDSYEQQRALLIQGNVLLALVDIRERGERLTVAVQNLAAYDMEAQAPIDFNPALFASRGPRAGQRGQNGGGYPPRNGHGSNQRDTANAPSQTNGRPQLRAVDPPQPPPSQTSAEIAPDPGGPRRLRISMEETTDERSDTRRLKKILARLDANPGGLPVELMIQTRAGEMQCLRLGTVAPDSDAMAQIQALLGVLGSATEVGEAVSAASSNSPAVNGILAASGG